MARALTIVLEHVRRLTPWRWAAIIVLAAAITAVALLPSRSRLLEPWYSRQTPEVRRAYRLGRVAMRAHLRAKLAETRALALARAGSPGSLVVVHDPMMRPGARALLDTLAQRQMARLTTASPDARVVIAVTSDSTLTSGRYTLLPEATDGRTCISVLLLATNSDGFVERPVVARLATRLGGGILGPCAFVYAFGPPGAAARQILAENPVFALDADWSRPRTWSNGLRTAGDSVRARSFIRPSVAQWQWTPDERACATGRLQSCRAAMRDTVWREQNASPARGVISSHQTSWSRWATNDLIAGMVREYGAAAFQRFWRADGTPEDAFRAATGRPLEEYAHRFWSGTIRDGQPGPGIPRGSALLAVVTALGFVGAAVVLAPRRVAR